MWGLQKLRWSSRPRSCIELFSAVGFGQVSGVELPGEVDGSLVKKERWRPIEHATLSYGYGLASTQLQLALSLQCAGFGRDFAPGHVTPTQRVQCRVKECFQGQLCSRSTCCVEKVVSAEGTAKKAAVPAYRVAGKTGTVHKVSPSGGYERGSIPVNFCGVCTCFKTPFWF